MQISRIDHNVLTVKNIQLTCDFYERTLGMETVAFGGGRKALSFGNQKFNLHEVDREIEPKAHTPTPGAIDICLITESSMDQVIDELNRAGVTIIDGPVQRTGADGRIISVYFRDPDSNLIEVSNYL